MQFLFAFDKAKFRAEFLVELFRVVTHHVQSTAFHGTLGTEGADDDMAARFYGVHSLPHISEPLFRRGEEMKDGAVVPKVVDTW